MKCTKFLWLSLLVGALALGACKSEQTGDGAAEGSAAAEAAPAEAAPAEAAPAEGSAAPEAAPAEAAPATQPAAGEGSGSAAAPAAAPVDPNFVASAESIHGTWAADFQAMLASQEMAEEERALAAAMLGSAQMDLTFGADGTMTMAGSMMGQQQTESGTWSMLSANGNSLQLAATTQKEGEEPETQNFTVTFNNANSITMADEGGEAIPFNRKP